MSLEFGHPQIVVICQRDWFCTLYICIFEKYKQVEYDT